MLDRRREALWRRRREDGVVHRMGQALRLWEGRGREEPRFVPLRNLSDGRGVRGRT